MLRPSFAGLLCVLPLLLLLTSAAPGQTQMPGGYILMLQDPPVSARFPLRQQMESVEGANYKRQIESRQAAVKADLISRNFTVTGSVSLLINALFVNAPESRVGELQSIPGVALVRPMRRFKASLDAATQVLNGPAAWNALGGISNAGLGVKIGIIDSGIDQNHAAFQDPSLPMPAGFPKYTAGHPEDQAYTTNKVIVARSYVRLLQPGTSSSNPAVNDVPDDFSPRDREGHGTGVASCAAAVPTVTPGVTSTGASVTIQGMAPKAYLGNYKIAGSAGVDDFANDQTLIQSVEDAVSDGMDVITTSWGIPASSDVAHDPTATAWEAAAKTGAVVLAAAGNSGENGTSYPNFNSISSPSNAPDVISVGATENSHVMLPAVSINAANAPASVVGIPAQPSDAQTYPSNQGANKGVLVDVTNLGNDGYLCTALPANSLNGAIALVERGPASNPCTFTTKAMNALAAGAGGMIIYWADSSAVTTISGVGSNNTGDANFVGPIVAISNAAGLALKNYIDSNPGQTVTIAAGGSEMDVSAWSQVYGYSPTVVSNMITGFSSTGPTPEGLMKPDVVAVGGNDIGYLLPDPNNFFLPSPSGIYMAAQSYDPNLLSDGTSEYSSNGYWAADGTSFATPLTAGAAALVKQMHAGQNLRGTQIKSLLVNSTAQTIMTDDSGTPVDAEWIGSGLVNAGAAVAASVTAEPSTISFGILNNATLPLTQNITLTNIGTGSVTLTATVQCCTVNANAGTLTNATVTISPTAPIALAAGATAMLAVTLGGKAPPASEYSGAILLQQGSTTVARIPFMMIEGDGVPANYNVLGLGGEGPPSTDLGMFQWQTVQVTDQYGAPVAGSPVNFTISPRGGVVLNSVANEPTCSSSATDVVCNTDQWGFAYADVVTGATARPVNVSVTQAGFSNTVTIQVPPSITGVAEAAAGLTTVAPGSYVGIYGAGLSNSTRSNGVAFNSNLTPATEVTDPVIANGAVLPLHIDFVTVSFDVPSAGISVPGHLTYVSPTQVNVQVPWELQGQSSAQMKVTIDGALFGNVYNLQLAAAAPAFFMYSGTAIGTDLAGNLLTTANPAKRGSTVVLYANGLGPVTNTPASGDPAGSNPLSKTTTTPVVMIGGQQANVAFAGLVPSLPGLYQLDVTVPAGIGTGAQNITVAVGGATSPTLTLPVM